MNGSKAILIFYLHCFSCTFGLLLRKTADNSGKQTETKIVVFFSVLSVFRAVCLVSLFCYCCFVIIKHTVISVCFVYAHYTHIHDQVDVTFIQTVGALNIDTIIHDFLHTKNYYFPESNQSKSTRNDRWISIQILSSQRKDEKWSKWKHRMTRLLRTKENQVTKHNALTTNQY